ncbi:MAG: 5'/3'-nucleotidase SurE [Anaerolineaceae bacterium]|nr:5'/3'-nucleotidase SurE [Anaerolineaceae bacterium]
MMQVLVTNDDGVFAPGLSAIAVALQEAGCQVTICAPDKNWSACGHVKTLTRPLRIFSVSLQNRIEAFACDGAPSDCVALAAMGALEREFDFVVSGINPNNNIGIDVTYSGTVTAAMEAGLNGLPGYAVSLDNQKEGAQAEALKQGAKAAVKVIKQLHSLGVNNDQAHDLVWNINLPFKPEGNFLGVRFTTAGVRVYRDRMEKRHDPYGKPYFWICGDMPAGREEQGNEYEAIRQGYISVCPIRMNMTDTGILESLKDAKLTL